MWVLLLKPTKKRLGVSLSSPSWLEGLDDAFARLANLHPKKIDLSLGRMRRVLEALGNPQDNLPPVVHIAGTNGKGSTLAMLRALLEGQGKKIHIYTSPHLVRFNERIVVAGKEVEDEMMTAAVIEVERANGNQPLTFFEAMTAAALVVFSQNSADFCLLETGLGGRLDATNVIEKPAVTLISSIDYDHQSFLGESLKEIAAEKAGIIKRNCPVLVAPQRGEVLEVLQGVAQKNQAPFFYAGKHWNTRSRTHARASNNKTDWVYESEKQTTTLPKPALQGEHQLENASLALTAAKALGFTLQPTEMAQALTQCQWRARLQPLTILGRSVYLDGGHNDEAGAVLAKFLAQLGTPSYLICAMRKTKSALGFLAHFKDNLQGFYALDLPQSNAVPGEGAGAYTAAELQQVAADLAIPAHIAEDLAEALAAIPQTTPPPNILIAGSLMLAGDVLKRFF